MKDELFLLQKAQDNLDAVKLLGQQGYFDIAASRAYYAMFYELRGSARGL